MKCCPALLQMISCWTVIKISSKSSIIQDFPLSLSNSNLLLCWRRLGLSVRYLEKNSYLIFVVRSLISVLIYFENSLHSSTVWSNRDWGSYQVANVKLVRILPSFMSNASPSSVPELMGTCYYQPPFDQIPWLGWKL